MRIHTILCRFSLPLVLSLLFCASATRAQNILFKPVGLQDLSAAQTARVSDVAEQPTTRNVNVVRCI